MNTTAQAGIPRDDTTMSLGDIARASGLSVATVRMDAASGRLAAKMVAGRILVTRAAYLDYVRHGSRVTLGGRPRKQRTPSVGYVRGAK